MQNKPNFQNTEMHASNYYTRAYSNETAFRRGKNKPNSKPIQTQTNPISEKPKMNVNSIVSKDYEDFCPCGAPKNKPNSNPISQKRKMNVSLSLTKDYDEKTDRGHEKTNPISKARKCARLQNHKNQNRYSADLKRASSLNTRFAGRLRTSELSSDKDVRICSRIDSILSVSLAIMVNQILKSSLRR